jgi:hypothetical protein
LRENVLDAARYPQHFHGVVFVMHGVKFSQRVNMGHVNRHGRLALPAYSSFSAKFGSLRCLSNHGCRMHTQSMAAWPIRQEFHSAHKLALRPPTRRPVTLFLLESQRCPSTQNSLPVPHVTSGPQKPPKPGAQELLACLETLLHSLHPCQCATLVLVLLRGLTAMP